MHGYKYVGQLGSLRTMVITYLPDLRHNLHHASKKTTTRFAAKPLKLTPPPTRPRGSWSWCCVAPPRAPPAPCAGARLRRSGRRRRGLAARGAFSVGDVLGSPCFGVGLKANQTRTPFWGAVLGPNPQVDTYPSRRFAEKRGRLRETSSASPRVAFVVSLGVTNYGE